MQMRSKRFWLTPLILLLIIVLLHLLSFQPGWVENFYCVYIYPFFSSALRLLTKWIPFSIGDVIYASAIVWAIIAIIQFFRHTPTWQKFFFALRNLLVKCLGLYIFFLLMWGLNYYRYGIGYTLNLIPDKYTTEELKTVTTALRDDLNTNRKLMDSLHINYTADDSTLKQAIQLYDTAKTAYPFLTYHFPDVKKMMFGVVGNYSGFLGYYNPFTGEAQVNTKVPQFMIPFTTCHEIGHQLGFASESEASFVGYLVIKKSNTVVFNYSAYFDLFGYANGELFGRDSVAARQNFKSLDTLVKKDFAEYRAYSKKYKNPMDDLFSDIYGSYLKAHNQPKGIDSYDEVVAWLVAYYKKYGKV